MSSVKNQLENHCSNVFSIYTQAEKYSQPFTSLLCNRSCVFVSPVNKGSVRLGSP
jgi:hypothetical protein